MPRTKFKLGDKVTFTRVITTKTEVCSHCEGDGRFEDDTHYGGISYVGCSKCGGKGRWDVSITPYRVKEGPFKVTAILINKEGNYYMLNQRILMDWKYEPRYMKEKELSKTDEK